MARHVRSRPGKRERAALKAIKANEDAARERGSVDLGVKIATMDWFAVSLRIKPRPVAWEYNSRTAARINRRLNVRFIMP